MPKSPVAQSAAYLAAFLRWLYALCRQTYDGLRKLPWGLLWRVCIAAQKLRALTSRTRRDEGGSAVNDDHRGFLTRDRVTDQDIQILPSREPAHKAFDVPVDAEIPNIDPSNSPPSVSPVSESSPSVTTTSIDSSAAIFKSTSAPFGSHTGCSDIRAILPEQFKRYDRRQIIPRKHVKHLVPAQTLSFASKDVLPKGWETFLHPEGTRYFFHTERRIFTDLNVCKPQNLANLTQVVQRIVDNIGDDTAPCYDALCRGASDPHLLVDLVIDLPPWDSTPTTGDYYFVNHPSRCPFWLQELPADNLELWYTIEGSIQGEQLRHVMEYQYWQHCNMFPNALPLTPGLIKELQECIISAIADISTSLTSTVSRSVEDLRTWLALVRNLECEGLGSGFTFSRLMEQFAKDRFDNFHGLPWARLNQDQSVYDPPGLKARRSYWIIALSPIFFFAPEVYLQSLEKAYVDKAVLTRIWKPLIHKVNSEWMDFILFATVILNANVAFLSITSVDALDNGRHSIVQIASYLSIVTSIGAFAIGQLLVRQNRTKFHESASDISMSVSRRSSKKYGLELLAFIWALPYSLLMWSMIFFFMAFASTCLRVQDVVARWIIGTATAILAGLVLWCIWDAWDMQDAHRPPTLVTWGRAIRDALHPIFFPPVSTEKPSRTRRLWKLFPRHRHAENDVSIVQ